MNGLCPLKKLAHWGKFPTDKTCSKNSCSHIQGPLLISGRVLIWITFSAILTFTGASRLACLRHIQHKFGTAAVLPQGKGYPFILTEPNGYTCTTSNGDLSSLKLPQSTWEQGLDLACASCHPYLLLPTCLPFFHPSLPMFTNPYTGQIYPLQVTMSQGPQWCKVREIPCVGLSPGRMTRVICGTFVTLLSWHKGLAPAQECLRIVPILVINLQLKQGMLNWL